ncbi:Slx4p interacting protein [Savitreella phatthalungensis]
MVLIVSGFPSKLAALQFEWAWQNPHLTRHREPDVLLTKAKEPTSKTIESHSPEPTVESGKRRTNRRKQHPTFSLTSRLLLMHKMLSTAAYRRWPLEVRFFSTDVWTIWKRQASKAPDIQLPLWIKVVEDFDVTATVEEKSNGAPPASKSTMESGNACQLKSLDAKCASLSLQQEASLRKLAEQNDKHCFVCAKDFDTGPAVLHSLLKCTNPVCERLFHATCLADAFLKEADTGQRSAEILPTIGQCPSCSTVLSWGELLQQC